MDATSGKKCRVICPMIICPCFTCCMIPCILHASKNNEKFQKWMFEDSTKTCQRCRSVRKATEEDIKNYKLFMESHESICYKL